MEGQREISYFNETIFDHVPNFLLYNAYVMYFAAFVVFLVLSEPSAEDINKYNEVTNECEEAQTENQKQNNCENLNQNKFAELVEGQKITKDHSQEANQIMKSHNFITIFVILSYCASIPLFFMINIKNLGLNYFSDSEVSFLADISVVLSVISTLLTGVLIDKFGASKILTASLVISTFETCLYYFYPDNLWVYYSAMAAYCVNDSINSIIISV